MRPCSALITNKALTDIMSSLANFFVMQQFVGGEMVPHGPCRIFGDTACYAGHMLMLSFLEHNLIWLIACYLFRYYILYVCDPKIKSIILSAIMVYTPSLVHVALWVRAYHHNQNQSPDPLDPALDLLNATIPINNAQIGQNQPRNPIVFWSLFVFFGQLAITAILVVACYLWIRNVLLNFLIEMGIQISSECKILNQQLVKILTFQVCIPFWIILGIVIWTLQYFLNVPGFLGYCCTVSFMLAPVISPFSYIIFVPHYWNFCSGKKTETSSTSCDTVTNNHNDSSCQKNF
ncbi:unnamed protein product [Caenorhabditis angaria]|uniref:G-protein coupled receptors family 1 profile domain-containing protein n=1 Tax=Caenorhabditis angaria TaxID=860376 RepID=A0A9P1N4B7_9PELO|nr:unnamed protein product [Caenorhabditis angaria]